MSVPPPGFRLLKVPEDKPPKLTHQLFRYPAKFHPPVVNRLIAMYSRPGQTILDPFVGSGTLLVEASASDRRSVGFDVDPVAVSVSAAKTRLYDLNEIRYCFKLLSERLDELRRPSEDYRRLMFEDISEDSYKATVASEGLWVPDIPNIFHWFRRYVLVDLARILTAVKSASVSDRTRLLIRVLFASIIRNSSNADPVPVSGLEYTAHMKRKDERGRLVDPFTLFSDALRKAKAAIEDFLVAVSETLQEPLVCIADSTKIPLADRRGTDVVITSPPYHNAVDYYRRHNLEMYWLGHVASASERLALLPRYIGRPKIPAKHPLLAEPWTAQSLAMMWEKRIRDVDPQRANDFRHYVMAMSRTFDELARVAPKDTPTIVVVGHSSWNRCRIPTRELFSEIAFGFTLEETWYYPVKNRYMSYARRNNASIDSEFVLVLRRSELQISVTEHPIILSSRVTAKMLPQSSAGGLSAEMAVYQLALPPDGWSGSGSGPDGTRRRVPAAAA